MAKAVAKKSGLLIDQLDFYQAANNSNESVKANFIIRQEEFALIIADLKNKQADDPLQHELLLGRRGSGKSTLLKRIQVEIEENKSLSKKYFAINLAEEQAGIYRLFDLWLEVLKELGNRVGQAFSAKEYSDFGNEQDYTRYLYASIHEVLKRKKKKVVLLLDNFDRIIESFHDDGSLLREMLLNYNDVQIIGGSTRMDEHFWQYNKPFYEFFRRHRLESLSSTEITALLDHWSKVMNLPQLSIFARQEPGKIEAIRILTDGLPRTLQFFIQLLIHDSTLYGYEYLRKVMDKVTPLYQERLNHLPPPQRKIVLEMAFLWEACLVKQLAEKCTMPGKLISAQLKNLSDNGIVETIATSKKNHLYRLSERFFNMWLIVTQGNPEQKRKAKWLTIFLENWYNAHEITSLVTRYTLDIEAGKIDFDKALLLTKTFAQSKHITVATRDSLLYYTMQLRPAGIGQKIIDLPQKYVDLEKRIMKLANQCDFIKAHEIIDEIENELDGQKFMIKAAVYMKEGRYKEAEQYFLKASWHLYTQDYGLNWSYKDIDDRDEDEQYLLERIKEEDIDALFYLAVKYYHFNVKKEDALILIRKYADEVKRLEPLQIIIEIWNGIFEDIEARIRKIIMRYDSIEHWMFFIDLLVQEQTSLVMNLFGDPEIGKELRKRYLPIYYAILHLNESFYSEETRLCIPPEVTPIVEKIIANVRERQAFYVKTKRPGKK